MSSKPYDRAWIHDNPELFTILHAINNTSLKERFLKDIEKMSNKGKTEMEIIDKSVRAAAAGKIPGYRKPTVDTLGKQTRRDDGGSQAGAPQGLQPIPYLLQIRTNVSYRGIWT